MFFSTMYLYFTEFDALECAASYLFIILMGSKICWPGMYTTFDSRTVLCLFVFYMNIQNV